MLNRTDPRGQDNLDAAAVLQETPAVHFLDTPLGARKAFSNAAALGLAVTELTPPDTKAAAEILVLFRALFARTTTPTR
jgi:chromosome partitioning protein